MQPRSDGEKGEFIKWQVGNQSPEQRSYMKKIQNRADPKSKSARHGTGSNPGSPDTKNINTEKIQRKEIKETQQRLREEHGTREGNLEKLGINEEKDRLNADRDWTRTIKGRRLERQVNGITRLTEEC